VNRTVWLVFLWGVAFAGSAFGQDLGTVILQKNSYAYLEGPEAGNRFLVKKGQVLAVVASDTFQGDLWLRVKDPSQTTRITGEGWTPMLPQEIQEKGDQPVMVFEAPVEDRKKLSAARWMPAAHLRPQAETRSSEVYPLITWQKVSYRTRVPSEGWIRGNTGIYRPAMAPAHLEKTQKEMNSAGIPKTDQIRLLSGVVQPGDDPQRVRWALGEPTGMENDASSSLRAVWTYPGVMLEFENNLLKTIRR